MGIWNWFSRKRKPSLEVVERSRGGSRMIRYGGFEFSNHKLGCTDESTLTLTELRDPHVDVFRIPPSEKRPFCTFVTGGMSDLPMSSPAELGAEHRRVELVF